MKIGIVGYQGSGKSTLFQWLTGTPSDAALAHTTQAAMATVPEAYVEKLCEIYQPKKVTMAALEMVDMPGLSRTHEGSAGRLALIREAGCLVVVVGAFGRHQPAADLQNLEEDLLIADLDIVSGRVARLQEQLKKPRPDRDKLQKELTALEPLLAQLDAAKPLRDMTLSPDQQQAIRSFQLFSEKPRLVVINVPDDEAHPERWLETLAAGTPAAAISLPLQLELSQMSEQERTEFCREMNTQVVDPGQLLRRIMDVSGQMLFFTAGEKEVRTWMIRRGTTAVEAAGNIHTDLARGFIRAETMNADDLVRLGSEREVKARNLARQEPKDYVIQDLDVVHIKFNV